MVKTSLLDSRCVEISTVALGHGSMHVVVTTTFPGSPCPTHWPFLSCLLVPASGFCRWCQLGLPGLSQPFLCVLRITQDTIDHLSGTGG